MDREIYDFKDAFYKLMLCFLFLAVVLTCVLWPVEKSMERDRVREGLEEISEVLFKSRQEIEGKC